MVQRRPKPKKEPERSRTLRYLILAAMLVPLLAIARVGNLWPQVVVAALGIITGHAYSYYFVERPSRIVRAIMFITIHLALAWMCAGLAGGATLPQAQFAIFAQAITSFDLRYRRSLFNTLIHSLANLYIAASLSRTAELGLYLLLFAGFVLAAFFVAEKEDGLKTARLYPVTGSTTHQKTSSHRRGLLLFGLAFGLATLCAIFTAFLFTPRFAGRPLVPPFTINVPLRGGIKAQIINPGVPLVQINGWSDGTSDYFYGFDTNLDLRYRGGLSNEMVMYVRSPSCSYWRSHSYDFYTGESWSLSDPTLTPVPRRRRVYFELTPPLGSPATAGPAQGEQQIVQSFTIAKDQPNLIFAAYRPAEIYIVAESISRDSGDSLRLPESLKAGMTYSVVSYRPNFDPAQLRQAPNRYPPAIIQRYLQLPPHISTRVRNLAQTLTAAQANNYDKVMALTNHLLTNYPYNFYPPPHPPGAEVVDTFLFEDKEGVCEQYVTALVVMARTLGIPARLVAGYGSGDYNPLTGYYEVRLNHAHSWVEVYFPEHGWVPFDPTPGWTPQPYPTPVQAWLFSGSQAFGFDLPIATLVSGGAAGLAFMVPFLVISTVLVGLGLLALYLVRRLRPAFAQSAPNDRPTDPTRRLILALYEQGAAVLARRRYRKREKWETLSEYAQNVGRLPALSQLTQAAEVAAYRPEAPGEEKVAEAKAALASLQSEIK